MTPCDDSLATDITKIIKNIDATPAITPEDGVWPNCGEVNSGESFGLEWLQGYNDKGGGRNKTKSRRKTKKSKKKNKQKSRRRQR